MTDSLRQRILDMLAETDTYLSGQEISEKLCVSRTSVWKHIQVLREKGYLIDSGSNQGYRLTKTPGEMIPEEILRQLKTATFGRKIIFYEAVDSTNTQAKNHAAEHPEGTIFLADTQLHGRGRLGRNWSSIPGKGIYCSLLLKPAVRPSIAGQFPLLTAVAIAESLKGLGVEARIKWPNDILVNSKKVCGILTEMGAELDQINYLVIGFGINVKHTPGDFPPEVQYIATSLDIASGQENDRGTLLCTILQNLERRYQQFLQEGFAPIRALWKDYTCTLGGNVKVSRLNQEPLHGEAVDLTEDGSLLLKLPDGKITTIFSGEIELLGRS